MILSFRRCLARAISDFGEPGRLIQNSRGGLSADGEPDPFEEKEHQLTPKSVILSIIAGKDLAVPGRQLTCSPAHLLPAEAGSIVNCQLPIVPRFFDKFICDVSICALPAAAPWEGVVGPAGRSPLYFLGRGGAAHLLTCSSASPRPDPGHRRFFVLVLLLVIGC